AAGHLHQPAACHRDRLSRRASARTRRAAPRASPPTHPTSGDRPPVTGTRKDPPMTSLDGAVVLVTGANGGLGRQFVTQALTRGATTVYATARNPQAWSDPRVVPLALDVTDPSS